jgi:hypothetical protein
MNNTLLKVTITLVALIVLGVRLIKPELKVDPELLSLLVIAAVPWLSSFVKGFEFFGVKIEFRENATSPQERGKSNEQQPAPTAFIAADNYFSRLLKYTPLEPIVGFIVASSMIPASSPGFRSLWAVFGVFLLLTFVYSRFVLKVRFVQTAILMLGFCVWVFAIGGPFVALSWYQRLYGGLALAVFTFAVPLFV